MTWPTRVDGMRKFLGLFLGGVILFFLFAQSAPADNVYATIRGTVTDASGAVLPGVQVTATNTSTGISTSTTSQDTGAYEFLQLPIGSYTVSATKQGFKTFKSTSVTLVVNQVYNLPIGLEVGVVSETVEVKAEAVQAETTSIQQTTVINSQQIVDLPLLGRNFTQLEQLAPGVVSASDRFGTFAVNGSQTQQSSYLINGTDTNDIALNTPGLLPSPDALQEFNLITSTINPEYGRNSGAIVNTIIKNGTNQWHGNAFDFYRDTFLNNRNFFSVGPMSPLFHQNQFGGTFGGPAWKDKTFFFLSYQGVRNAVAVNSGGQAAPQTTSVFSNAQRGGNFSENGLAIANGPGNTTPFAIVGDDGVSHPANTPWFGATTVNGAPSALFPTAGVFNCGDATVVGGNVTKCSSPNFGILGTGSFNTVSKNLMNLFVPPPNTGSSQFTFTPTNTSDANQGIVRIDHNISSKDLLWGSAIFNQNNATQGLPFTGANLPGFSSFSTAGTKNFTIAESHTFNSTTQNEFRLGYFRLNFQAVEPQKPVLPSALGFTGITPNNTAAAGAPTIAVSGLFTLGFSDNGPQPRKDQNYQITDNFSKIIGKHTLKFGFDARRFTVDNPFFFLNNGHFDFNGGGSFSTGVSAADFLLGIPDDFLQGSGAIINARAYEYYSYAQDQWKVKSNLTLTLGAGYQIDTPYQNKQFGGLAYNCIIPNQQSKVFPTAPLGMNFPGDPGCTNSGTKIKYGHVGPRFGFAWSPSLGRISGGPGKFSVRGGFGVYYNRFEEETALQNLGAPPFGLLSFGATDAPAASNPNPPSTGSPGFANPFADVTGVGANANKFPFTPPAPGSAVDFTFFEPMSLNTNSPNLSTPSSMNFNLNVQREFAGNTVMTLGYVGALGRHLYRAYEGNFITAAGQAACKASLSCVANKTFQTFFFPSHTVLGANVAQCPPTGDCFSSVGTQFTDGTSNYDAFQVNVTKGMTRGLQLITSYTWSHAIDNGSGFENSGFGSRGTNVLVPSLNVGDSGNDARQRYVVGYVYQVPSLHHLANWANDRIFGGWKLTGITTLQTGFPVNFSDTGFRSLTCDTFSFYGCPDNPNQVVSTVRTLDPRNSTFNGKQNFWFDPSSFKRVPNCTFSGGLPTNAAVCGQYGNTRRNSLHGPGINNFDFSLQKDTKITERTSFQMGIEAFNLFNHTQFGQPVARSNSSNFGRITSAASGRLVQLRAKVTF